MKRQKRYFVRTKLYDYLSKHGSLDNAKKNGEALSELAALHPEDRIDYSQVARVLKLLEHLKSENIR